MDEMLEEYTDIESDKISALIIYDICEDHKRSKLAKLLKGYGFRVQKSAFEIELNKAKYRMLLSELETYGGEEDNIRIYRIYDRARVVNYGKATDYSIEDFIII